MKALQVYKFTFNNDFMMNWELNFSVTRNYFGYVLIFWWVTLFLSVSYRGKVLEMNFCPINFDNLLKIFSFPTMWVIWMYCPCITILEYTSQSRKFEKLINIYLNKKTLRRIQKLILRSSHQRCSLKKFFLKIW